MLESKVAQVASKKCSVEEVTALQLEVGCWLTEVPMVDAVRAPSSSAQSSSLTRSHIQSSALYLSSLLLKAILANHIAFSDASKAAKHAEVSLKSKVDKLEHEKGRCYDPGPHFSFSGPHFIFPRHSLPTNPLSVTCHQVTWFQGVPRILLNCHITLQAHWLLQDSLSDQ